MKSYAEIVFAAYDRLYGSASHKNSTASGLFEESRKIAKQIMEDEAALFDAERKKNQDALDEAMGTLDRLRSPLKFPTGGA